MFSKIGCPFKCTLHILTSSNPFGSSKVDSVIPTNCCYNFASSSSSISVFSYPIMLLDLRPLRDLDVFQYWRCRVLCTAISIFALLEESLFPLDRADEAINGPITLLCKITSNKRIVDEQEVNGALELCPYASSTIGLGFPMLWELYPPSPLMCQRG